MPPGTDVVRYRLKSRLWLAADVFWVPMQSIARRLDRGFAEKIIGFVLVVSAGFDGITQKNRRKELKEGWVGHILKGR